MNTLTVRAVSTHRTMEYLKLFTPVEAERTLPLVSRVVGDIVAAYGELQREVREFNRLTRQGPRSAGDAEALRQRMERRAESIDGFVRELEGLGCHFKGFDEGLVDFPSHWRGRTINLCWKLGEPAIAWWHELKGGYAGRQPLPPEMRRELDTAESAG